MHACVIFTETSNVSMLEFWIVCMGVCVWGGGIIIADLPNNETTHQLHVLLMRYMCIYSIPACIGTIHTCSAVCCNLLFRLLKFWSWCYYYCSMASLEVSWSNRFTCTHITIFTLYVHVHFSMTQLYFDFNIMNGTNSAHPCGWLWWVRGWVGACHHVFIQAPLSWFHTWFPYHQL